MIALPEEEDSETEVKISRETSPKELQTAELCTEETRDEFLQNVIALPEEEDSETEVKISRETSPKELQTASEISELLSQEDKNAMEDSEIILNRPEKDSETEVKISRETSPKELQTASEISELLSQEDKNAMEDSEIILNRPEKDSHITGVIHAETDGYGMFMIPYEKGWSLTIDGKETELLRGDIGFLACEIPEGDHTLELTFQAPGLKGA